MKIQAIALHNFTRYEATTVGFEDTVNIVVAENAAGKTSIVDAITYVLTGACARTDKAGRGAEAMIRTGAKEAGVGLKIGPNQQIVSRAIPGGLTIEGHEGGQKELQELLYEIIGAGDGAITAALNTTDFLCLSPSEQKSLLFGLLGLSFEREDVSTSIAAEVPLPIEAHVLQMLDAVPGNLFDGTGQTWANLYKHFYELRRSFKRQLKDLGEQPPLSLVQGTPFLDKEHLLGEIEGLEQLLYEVRSKRDKVMDETARFERLEQEITSLRSQMETAADTKKAQKQLDTVQAEVAKLEQEATTADSKAEGLREACEALQVTAGKRECPMAPGVITCPLTAPKRQALVDNLAIEIQKLDKEATAAVDAAGLLSPRYKELVLMASAPDRATLEGMIAEREKALNALPSPVAPASAESEILDLQKRIAERKAALEEITREEGARAAVEKQAAERTRLSEEVEVLEVLVDLTSPKGIPGRLLGETIGPLERLANERLQQLTGGRYQLTFVTDPDFGIVVTHDGAQSELKRLSSSERLRVGIIVQDAISRLSGLRVMVIDDADTLDPKNRALLTETLIAIKADYDSIFVLSTIGPGGVTDPGIEDVAVYRIVDGDITRVRENVMAQ